MKTPVSFSSEAKLSPTLAAFPYQAAAVSELKDLEFAAVFHEQGLGKTKIAIDLFLAWLRSEAVDGVMVVTKRGLVSNWKRELKLHTHLAPRILTQDRAALHRALHSKTRLFLTHYEVLRSVESHLAQFAKFRRLGAVLDESQKIKNPHTELSQAVLRLRESFCRRLILTGTPVANRPFDIWSQIFFLDGGKSLGQDYEGFKNSLDLPSRREGGSTDGAARREASFVEALASVHPKIASFTIRERKGGGAIDLPSKTILTVQARGGPTQLEMYNRIRDEMAIEIVRDGEATLDISDGILKRLLRLVQVASNPGLLDQRYKETPGKLKELKPLLREIVEKEEKAILWTNFVANVGWLAGEFRDMEPARIHGRMDIAAREKNIDRFMSRPSCRLLIATPASAKEGLTLTVANHAIFYDRSFSLDDYLQAQDRIHRISQKKECFVYNLQLAGTVDDWVEALLQAKAASARLAQGDTSVEEFETEMRFDFSELLRAVLGDAQKEALG